MHSNDSLPYWLLMCWSQANHVMVCDCMPMHATLVVMLVYVKTTPVEAMANGVSVLMLSCFMTMTICRVSTCHLGIPQ